MITALMVPVASTTSSIPPRSTFAVKCCACVLRFRPKAASSPATTTTPVKMSHLLLIFISGPRNHTQNASFVSQCFNRIQQGRFPRWVVSEKHADSDREHSRNDDGFQRHLHRPTQCLSYQIGTKNPKKHASGTPDQAKHDGFSQKLKLDGLLGRSHRHPHSDLARALSHRNKHYVHNPDSPHDQGNRVDGDEPNRAR